MASWVQGTLFSARSGQTGARLSFDGKHGIVGAVRSTLTVSFFFLPSPLGGREKILSEIELNSKRAGLHGFETVKVPRTVRSSFPCLD